MAIRATQRVANHHDPTKYHAEADYSGLAVPLSLILDFERRSSEDNLGVLEIQPALRKGGCALLRIEGDRRTLL